MDVPRVVGWAKGHRNVLVVVALILLFAGVDLILNVPKDRSEQWFAAPLLAFGFLIFALLFWPTAKPGPRPPGDTLARRLLWRLTWRGRLVPFFPLFGVALILADVLYNRFLSPDGLYQQNDYIVLLLGAMFIGYRFVPPRYERERDFVFLFLTTLSLIIVLPLLLVRLARGDPSASVDVYSSVALAPETSAVLNLLGVQSTVEYLPGNTAPGITFRTAAGSEVTVLITTACSGLYSFAIFSAAFVAFVLTEQRKLTRRILAFFALGIAFAYLANILRMVVIILVGYLFDSQGTGIQNMLIAHSNAGWIIFMAWIALFWFLLFRFLPPESAKPKKAADTEASMAPRKRGTFCGICGIVLTPAIPATRCTCGRFYHLECLTVEGRCPECSAPSSPYPAVDHPVV